MRSRVLLMRRRCHLCSCSLGALGWYIHAGGHGHAVQWPLYLEGGRPLHRSCALFVVGWGCPAFRKPGSPWAGQSRYAGTEIVRGKVTLFGVADQAIYLEHLERPGLIVRLSETVETVEWDDRKLTDDDVAEEVDLSTALSLNAAEWISLAPRGRDQAGKVQ